MPRKQRRGAAQRRGMLGCWGALGCGRSRKGTFAPLKCSQDGAVGLSSSLVVLGGPAHSLALTRPHRRPNHGLHYRRPGD